MWKRLRTDAENERDERPDWPEPVRQDLLVWNPCDGYHIWSRGYQCPPGTYYSTELPPAPTD